MAGRTATLFALILLAGTLPCEAAKRSVHLFGGTYVFNFERDFRFVKRLNEPEKRRETVTFEKDGKSIIVSGSIYDAASTAPLISREAFMAKMAAAQATNVKYVNEERDEGRAGSVLIGSCNALSCLYKMSRDIDRKLWISVSVLCSPCQDKDAQETGALAETLYKQIKGF